MALNTRTTTTTTTTTSYSTSPARRTAASNPQQSSSAQDFQQPHGTIQSMSDHPRPNDMGHGYGEDEEQHQHHANVPYADHWGLHPTKEEILFYSFAIPSWCLNIVAGILGSYYQSSVKSFIITAALFQAFSWAAWWQTVVQMMQRASWVRDEENLADRRRFLHLAVRLNRLMLPTAIISFCIFIVAYVRRFSTHDVANWLLFLIIFIFNTVGCVMNAYNNITWESDRLEYEEGNSPYGNTLLAILGIPTKPKKSVALEE